MEEIREQSDSNLGHYTLVLLLDTVADLTEHIVFTPGLCGSSLCRPLATQPIPRTAPSNHLPRPLRTPPTALFCLPRGQETADTFPPKRPDERVRYFRLSVP